MLKKQEPKNRDLFFVLPFSFLVILDTDIDFRYNQFSII